MIGLNIDSPANIFVENESIVNSSMRPESTLKEKYILFSYNIARESFINSESTTLGIPSE